MLNAAHKTAAALLCYHFPSMDEAEKAVEATSSPMRRCPHQRRIANEAAAAQTINGGDDDRPTQPPNPTTPTSLNRRRRRRRRRSLDDRSGTITTAEEAAYSRCRRRFKANNASSSSSAYYGVAATRTPTRRFALVTIFVLGLFASSLFIVDDYVVNAQSLASKCCSVFNTPHSPAPARKTYATKSPTWKIRS